MRVATFQYSLVGNRWSRPELPSMDSPNTLVLAFGATEIQTAPQVLQTIKSRYPSSHVLGCSTAGEVFDGRLTDGTLCVAVVQFDNARLKSASIAVRDHRQSQEAGASIGSQLVASDQPQAVILFSDGLRLNHSQMLEAIQRQVGPIPVVGALAADSQRYEASWVWCGERLQSGLVGAVGIYGTDVTVQSAVSEVWGASEDSERVVTQSDGNVVFSIGGLPATEVCRGPGGLRPLRIFGEADSSWFASPLGVNESSSAVVFNRPIAAGTRVQLIQAEPRYLIDGATEVGTAIEALSQRATNAGEDCLAIANSCAARRLFLGNLAHNEVTALARKLPENVPLIGLYSYGDVSPNASNRIALHEAGFGVVLVSEKASVSRRRARETAELNDKTEPGRGTASFRNALTSTSLVEVRPTTLQMGSAAARLFDLGSLRFVAISGTINESFRPSSVAEFMTGRVVLDLARVDLITSFGVRGWLEMMSEAERNGATEIYLAHCSEPVVNQMLMIRNFRGRGRVVSIGAPYICTVCSSTFEYLLDCEQAAAELRAQEPPDVACPSCGNRAVFDEDPGLYLDFLGDDIGRSLPDDVRGALAERRLAQMTEVDDAIEKRVEGDRTGFRINRVVDEKIRWKRVLSGLEGGVRLDFARSKGATDVGAERFVSALRMQMERVTEILLDQLPLTIVEHLIDSEPMPKIRVRTISLPARCANCGLVRQAAVDPAGIRDATRHGLQPESECRRCSGSVPIALPPNIVAYFSGGLVVKPRTIRRQPPPIVWVALGGAILLLIIVVALVAS